MIIILIMNLQQIIYNTIFSPPNDRFTASPQAEITGPPEFHRVHEIPKKGQTAGKVQTPGQESI